MMEVFRRPLLIAERDRGLGRSKAGKDDFFSVRKNAVTHVDRDVPGRAVGLYSLILLLSTSKNEGLNRPSLT
jgi:hypothetical protein